MNSQVLSLDASTTKMWNKSNFFSMICVSLLLQLVAARTVLHRRTEIDSDGEEHTKTWTSHEPDEDFPTSGSAADDGFQTFNRNGITLRIKPQTTTLRIGGKNTSPDQLLEQAKHAKDLELLAVRQLLNTGHPVKRTTFENGRKHTSTYTLEPDGSIVCKKVEDIDMAEVERRFEEILKKQQAKHNPDKLSDWEWAGQDKSKVETSVYQTPRAPLQPSWANKPNKPSSLTPPSQGVPIWQRPSFERQPDTETEEIFGGGRPSLKPYPQLPNTWDSDLWAKNDPFNPPELPTFGGFNSEFDSFDKPSPPVGQTGTFTSTHTDSDGNKVQTTFTAGPNEWKRKTVKISSNFQPTDTTTIPTQTLPSLEDFLKSQYHPNKDFKSSFPSSIASTSTTPKTVKTIKIEDLPPVAVLNINKPADEQFLHPIGPTSGDQKPIQTLKIDNITPSPDGGDQQVELTKVRTLTKTVHGNQAPSSGDLDPNMLDILQRAGIKPEDITNVNGQTITKTRVEPDGRTVTTTYRVSPTNGFNSFEAAAPRNPNYPGASFGARSPYAAPTIFGAPMPSNHHSASHFGVDFRPFSTGALDDTPTGKAIVRDREPLEPQHEDEENTPTLNPLLIHPVNSATSDTKGTPKRVKSAIAEFLAQIGLSVSDLDAHKGEFVKTIVDDDGRVLTARFVLSSAVPLKVEK